MSNDSNYTPHPPGTLVLDNNPQIDDALIQRLTYDLAHKIHLPQQIAKRYGFTCKEELEQYLREHPKIILEATRLRTLFESEANTEARVRAKFLHATESLIPDIHNLVHDIRTPISARIDGFKQIQRGAGVDSAPREAHAGGISGGVPFTLNINFRNMEPTRITGTTVVNPDEIPPPAQQPRFITTDANDANDNDDDFDEEV